MRQGTRANFTGAQLEKFVEDTLRNNGYQFVERADFDEKVKDKKPIYTTQYPLESIYETPLKCDFILYHPIHQPDCLIIEAKWQQSSGSVDEKFPYLVLNIREKFPCSTVVIIEGGGYRVGALKWLKRQEDEKLIHVFNMADFFKWAASHIEGKPDVEEPDDSIKIA